MAVAQAAGALAAPAPRPWWRSRPGLIVESEKPVCAVEEGRVVGVVDKEAVLTAIAGESG